MSKYQFDARRKLAQAVSLLRQGNLLNAVQLFQKGLRDMLREPLLRSERTEFEESIARIVPQIAAYKQTQDVLPGGLDYTPQQEKLLVKKLAKLLGVLELHAFGEANRRFMELEANKQKNLKKGTLALQHGDTELAESFFTKLLQDEDNNTDVALLAHMSDAYDHAGMPYKALDLLEKATICDAGSAHLYNTLGVLYRKTGQLDKAIANFENAIAIAPDAPYLYFNIGRVYIDAGQWGKAMETAQKSLELFPDFSEAKMMAIYVQKHLAKQ